MSIKYVWVGWEFNKGAWGQAIGDQVAEHGIEFVAEMMGVVPNTLKGWIKMYQSSYGDYPWPQMSNFMRFCNEFNYDPRQFFILGDNK